MVWQSTFTTAKSIFFAMFHIVQNVEFKGSRVPGISKHCSSLISFKGELGGGDKVIGVVLEVIRTSTHNLGIGKK